MTRAALALCALACASGGVGAAAAPAAAPRVEAASTHATLMTYNVENLFDTRDDPAKDDDAYLPLAQKDAAHRARCRDEPVAAWRAQCETWDWSDDVFATKVERLARAILQVDGGRGPDVLALQEVENRDALERLRERLGAARYPTAVLIEGDDPRGIDVAFLSRLPLRGTPRLHRVPRARGVDGDVRGILEATFALPDGTPLTGYCVHLPAPGHPGAARVAALDHLRRLVETLPAGRAYFAAGDFNVTAEEERERRVLATLPAAAWVAAHGYCADCRGTYYYRRGRAWSFLDTILLAASLDGAGPGWRLDRQSVGVANGVAEQSTSAGHPAAFRLPRPTGVSDHWPLFLRLVLKN
jgi:endonuclease/exonuclease/phosphatase family metal-dependent hydrolase